MGISRIRLLKRVLLSVQRSSDLFTLTVSPDPLVAGQSGEFSVSDATAIATTYLAYSLDGLGNTFVPHLNVTLDLAQPRQFGRIKFSNSIGEVRWRSYVPIHLVGLVVWFQSVQWYKKSDVVTITIQ